MPVSTLAIYDERNMPHPTIWLTKCDILIEICIAGCAMNTGI